jgi:hypothetical protein
MHICNFTYTHYDEILELIKESDYKVSFFNEIPLDGRTIIIRHDVDIDMEKAYKIAFMEHRHGIRTTYFILIRSPFYNIFEKNCWELIKRISELGHQIGLHYDETFYNTGDIKYIAEQIDKEAVILSDCLKIKVWAVSFHRPSRIVLDSDIQLNNSLLNTYSKRFLCEFKYISDSRGMWKEGCLCRYLKKDSPDYCKYDCIHALMHPVWWSDKQLSTSETLKGIFADRLNFVDKELSKNIDVYKPGSIPLLL